MATVARARAQAKRFSKAMKAPLIFCSTSHSINVQKIFKIVLSKVRLVLAWLRRSDCVASYARD